MSIADLSGRWSSRQPGQPARFRAAPSRVGTVTCNGNGLSRPTTHPNINIPNGFPNDVGVDNVVGKVDFTVNERNSISGMYFFGNNTGTVEDFPELQSNWRSDIHTRAQVVGGSWIWTPSSRWVNEARVGYNRLYQPTLPGDLNTPASSYGLDTGVSGPIHRRPAAHRFRRLLLPGLGGFKWPKFQGPDSITQFVDHISYTAGKHSVKFGGELHHNNVTNAAYGNARGSITFLGGVLSPGPPPTALRLRPARGFFCRRSVQGHGARWEIRHCTCTTGRTACSFRMTGGPPRI